MYATDTQQWKMSQRWYSCGFLSDLGTMVLVFMWPFCHCCASKMVVLTFVKEHLLWLIEWRHWLTNRWHAVCGCHTFGSTRIAWNPSRVGAKKRIWYQVRSLKENPENRGEPTRVGTNGKGAKGSTFSWSIYNNGSSPGEVCQHCEGYWPMFIP